MTWVTMFLLAALAFWVLLETGLEYFFRSPLEANRQDGGHSTRFNLVVSSVIVVWGFALAFDALRASRVALYMPRTACGLLAAGLLLRLYAVGTLRKQFTVDLAIQPGHRLIQSGPYRKVRHPSYTGALMCFSGLALSVGYWGTALLMLLPIGSAYFWRIRKEERILAKAFGSAYRDYCGRTCRLIPGIL